MKISKTGYKKKSKDKNEPALLIPSNSITMKGVPHPVYGMDDTGYAQMMYPGLDYTFPGDYVYELPIAQDGYTLPGRFKNPEGNWLSKYETGGEIEKNAVVSKIWKTVTGSPWSEAKKQGLTDGSFQANLALRERLLSGEFGNVSIKKETAIPTSKKIEEAPTKLEKPKRVIDSSKYDLLKVDRPTADAESTYRNVRNIVNAPNTVEPVKQEAERVKRVMKETGAKTPGEVYQKEKQFAEWTQTVNNQQSTLSAAPEKGVSDYANFAWDVATHPLTAAGYKLRGQEIPMNFTKGETNPSDLVNPLEMTEQLVKSAGRIVTTAIDPDTYTTMLPKAAGSLAGLIAGENVPDAWNEEGLKTLGTMADVLSFVPVAPKTLGQLRNIKSFSKGLTSSALPGASERLASRLLTPKGKLTELEAKTLDDINGLSSLIDSYSTTRTSGIGKKGMQNLLSNESDRAALERFSENLHPDVVAKIIGKNTLNSSGLVLKTNPQGVIGDNITKIQKLAFGLDNRAQKLAKTLKSPTEDAGPRAVQSFEQGKKLGERLFPKSNNLIDLKANQNKDIVPLIGDLYNADKNTVSKLRDAVRTVLSSQEGTKFIGSQSLSTDSWATVSKKMEDLLTKGIVKFDSYRMAPLNTQSYSFKTRVPSIISADLKKINENITHLNNKFGLTLPKARVHPRTLEIIAPYPIVSKSPRLSTATFKEGGWLTKYQAGGNIIDPLYGELSPQQADSLALYNSYLIQDKLMGKGNKKVNLKQDWTIKALKEARKEKPILREDGTPILNVDGTPMISAQDFQNEWDQFHDDDGKKRYAFYARKEDEKLIKYYKSLGFTDDNIMYHSSPDVVHPKIKPIGTYDDGTALSPIYKKPSFVKDNAGTIETLPDGRRVGVIGVTSDTTKPIQSKTATLNTKEAQLQQTAPIRVNPNYRAVTETYYANFDPGNEKAGQFSHYVKVDPNTGRETPIKGTPSDLYTKKEGGWLQKYQDGAEAGPRISNLPPTPNLPTHPINKGYVPRRVPGVLGSMTTEYVNPNNSQDVEVTGRDQEAQQRAMETSRESDEIWKYLPPTMAGAFAFSGANKIAQGDPIGGAIDLAFSSPLLPRVFSKATKTLKQLPGSSNQLNLEEIRRAYHNSERFLQPEEIRLLHKHGHGLRENYRTDMSNFGRGTNQGNPNNQLASPPSEIEFMPDGTTRTSYNQQPITDYVSGSYTPDYAPTQTGFIDLRRPNFRRANSQTSLQNTLKKDNPINKSGLTKEELLERASAKDKDIVSKMSETEFENTVLKPSGEIVPYYEGSLEPQFSGSQNVTAVSPKEYTNAFNEKLDLLNDIIAKRNKSGIEYRVKGLDENGQLTFYTPEQSVAAKLTNKQKENIEWFTRDPNDYLINKLGLKQEGNKWKLSDPEGDEIFDSLDHAISEVRKEVDKIMSPKTISGESTWGVNIQPGQWTGNVEDIANETYFRSIPGLEMSNTSSGVFADNVARKGTGAYESINEYLKTLDLGRVKPGFNSQTEFSRGAWENFIKSGRGVGYYKNPRTVYGTMKTAIPTAIGTGAATAIAGSDQPQQKHGGWLSKYQEGGKAPSKYDLLKVDLDKPVAESTGVNVFTPPFEQAVAPTKKVIKSTKTVTNNNTSNVPEPIKKTSWEKDRELLKPEDTPWYSTFNYENWGVPDYSEYSSFNSAFRNARTSGNSEFMYKGERYNTKLIPKKDSDLYHESKDFLSNYYKTEPFKSLSLMDSTQLADDFIQNKYGTTWMDYYDKIITDPLYVDPEKDNYKRASEISDSLELLENRKQLIPPINPEFQKYIKDNLGKKELEQLMDPSYYFSITNQKPKDMSEDGYVDPKNKKIFVRTNTEEGKLNTTYIHELSHKGDLAGELAYGNSLPPIDVDALNKYGAGMSQEMFNYVSDPSETEARKMSTLFYLNKSGLPYKSGTITKETLSNLYDKYNKQELPYDIGQLLQLFRYQKEDLLKYLNNDFSYKKKRFQDGGPQSSYYFEPTYVKGNENMRPNYDPLTKDINWRDVGEDTMPMLEHEKYHWLQDLQGRMHLNTGQGPVKRPEGPVTNEYAGNYYNRKGEEVNYLGNKFIKYNPSFEFVPEDITYDKYIDNAQYDYPWTVEGEAQDYENYIRSGGKSIFKKGGVSTSAEGYYDYINGYKGVYLSNGGNSKIGWLNNYK